MTVVRWGRDEALRPRGPHAWDDLDGTALVVIEGLDVDDPLPWTGRAPCVVAALGTGPIDVDVVVSEDDVDALVQHVTASPRAAHVLVDVLRVSEHLDVASALEVESFAYSMLLAGEEHRRWLETTARPASKSASPGPVRVERSDGELRITLCAAENRNAFSASVRDAVLEALAVAEADDSVAVVITGDGPVFSSGGDLTEFGSGSDVVRAHEIRTLRSVGAVLARLRDRVTVEVHGACVGAGVELAAFAGSVVARPDASFRLPEVAMGLIPGAGGTVSIPRRIGRHRTAALALLGRAIDADTATAWRLVDRITP